MQNLSRSRRIALEIALPAGLALALALGSAPLQAAADTFPDASTVECGPGMEASTPNESGWTCQPADLADPTQQDKLEPVVVEAPAPVVVAAPVATPVVAEPVAVEPVGEIGTPASGVLLTDRPIVTVEAGPFVIEETPQLVHLADGDPVALVATRIDPLPFAALILAGLAGALAVIASVSALRAWQVRRRDYDSVGANLDEIQNGR